MTVKLCRKGMPPKRIRRNFNANEFQLLSLCIVPMLLIIIFCYVPMFGIIIAFKDYKFDLGIFGSEWVGFRNFTYFLTSNEFFRITRNTLVLNFAFIVTGIIAAVIVAVLLFEVKSRKTTKIVQTTFITPQFLSWVVVSYMVYAILHPQNGLLNVFLSKIGMEKIDWYTKPDAWPVILTIASLWKHVGMDSVMYYAALMEMDSSLFEAAEVDGANKPKIIRKIIIPNLIPIISILAILKIGSIFRADFGLFYQVTRNVPMLYSTTDVVDTYIFRSMREVGDMGMSAAAGFLQSIVGFIMVMITNWASKKIDPNNGLF